MISWFKKISHRNVRLGKELKDFSWELANIVFKYFKNKKQNTDINQITIINPYNNEKIDITILIIPKYKHPQNPVAFYNFSAKSLVIIPYNLPKQKYANALNEFQEYISHELTHIIDVKYKVKKYDDRQIEINKNYSDFDYFTFAPEFDAYSQQIAEHIKNKIKENINNKKLIENWLKSSLIPLPSILLQFSKPINIWHESDLRNKTKYIRILKDRIFKDVLQTEKD